MKEVTIEIWSSKARDYGTYTLFEKQELIETFAKTYNTESSKRAMSFAKRFLKKLRREGALNNQESTTIKIK